MNHQNRILPGVLRSVAMPVLLLATFGAAQTRPVAPAQAAPPTRPAATAPAPTDKDIDAIQDQLIKLLRMSPTLTSVVAHDPSLLSNQEYVSRNNPELAQFLATHPEVVRNPEFYLFTRMDGQGGRRDQVLQRAVWPELTQLTWHEQSTGQKLAGDLPPFLGFACLLGALIWLIRQLLENRRWSRIFKLQSEVHGKLIDKFGSNQELALYMGTEAGKRFLEAAPIPVGFEPEQRMPNAVARVLNPLQIGIVLVLLGAGFFLLRNVRPDPDMQVSMLVLGTVALMPGLGFIISAGVTWVLAGRLGLMPENPAASNKSDAPFDAHERQ